jgi:ELWxxDGT repeat protein
MRLRTCPAKKPCFSREIEGMTIAYGVVTTTMTCGYPFQWAIDGLIYRSAEGSMLSFRFLRSIFARNLHKRAALTRRRFLQLDPLEPRNLMATLVAPNGPENPLFLTPSNGSLFFGVENSVSGFELWKSNGFAAGTQLVKSFPDDTSGSSFFTKAHSLVDVGGTL